LAVRAEAAAAPLAQVERQGVEVLVASRPVIGTRRRLAICLAPAMPVLVGTALALAGLLGCGGKAVIDGTPGVGGTGGGTSTSSTSSGAGGCDAASHTIDIADYNVGCTVASDCMPVFIGSFCTSCWCPLGSAINVADKVKYDAEAQIKSAGVPPPTCNCPASHGICVQGQCAVQVP
jgi:hypothetical protein